MIAQPICSHHIYGVPYKCRTRSLFHGRFLEAVSNVVFFVRNRVGEGCCSIYSQGFLVA